MVGREHTLGPRFLRSFLMPSECMTYPDHPTRATGKLQRQRNCLPLSYGRSVSTDRPRGVASGAPEPCLGCVLWVRWLTSYPDMSRIRQRLHPIEGRVPLAICPERLGTGRRMLLEGIADRLESLDVVRHPCHIPTRH
ncbi:uncharacterized protein VTP21DRAFT_880 [Calcarisporiella thermophila]|uniref:uncharacterized protein n=1 Tax=Calcarisporiella thermophila TaxID=911321 RepID=UPI003741EE08